VAEWQPSGPEPGEEHRDIPRDPAGDTAMMTRGSGTDVIILTDSDSDSDSDTDSDTDSHSDSHSDPASGRR
jgi:hypothetical protein